MPVRATVLIPTFDHGPTLRYAASSALAQTGVELELFIVGDGVPEETRQIVRELERNDERVRFFDNEKGPRHGELHRHVALAEATGEIVCYLADDDLWLPEHLEGMLEVLTSADFAHSMPVRVYPDGTVGGWTVDLKESADRQLLLDGQNRVPLACSGHTLRAYRRLPHGWRTAPLDVPTDLYMFQQFLAQPWVRAVSGVQPTCLHFPSPDRTEMTLEERCAELELWIARIEDPEWRRSAWPRIALAAQSRAWARADRAIRTERGGYQALDRELHAERERREAVEGELRAERERREAVEGELRAERERREAVDRDIEAMREAIGQSLTWRLRGRLLSLPLLGRLLRWVGKVLAGPGDRPAAGL